MEGVRDEGRCEEAGRGGGGVGVRDWSGGEGEGVCVLGGRKIRAKANVHPASSSSSLLPH